MSEPDIPLADQIECVERELAQRARVYPRLVKSGRMTPAMQFRETHRMRAVLATLKKLDAQGRLL